MRAFAAALIGLVLVACSPAPSVAPSATTTSTAAPTPSASSSATARPSAASAPDPAIGLKIASPYTLSALDPAIEAGLRQQFAASAGAFGSLIGIGGRSISENGIVVGNVLLVSLPAGMMSDAVYKVFVDGLTSNTGITLATTTISSVEVSSGSDASVGGLSVFKDGDNIVFTQTPTAAGLTAITTALVTPNH